MRVLMFGFASHMVDVLNDEEVTAVVMLHESNIPKSAIDDFLRLHSRHPRFAIVTRIEAPLYQAASILLKFPRFDTVFVCCPPYIRRILIGSAAICQDGRLFFPHQALSKGERTILTRIVGAKTKISDGLLRGRALKPLQTKLLLLDEISCAVTKFTRFLYESKKLIVKPRECSIQLQLSRKAPSLSPAIRALFNSTSKMKAGAECFKSFTLEHSYDPKSGLHLESSLQTVLFLKYCFQDFKFNSKSGSITMYHNTIPARDYFNKLTNNTHRGETDILIGSHAKIYEDYVNYVYGSNVKFKLYYESLIGGGVLPYSFITRGNATEALAGKVDLCVLNLYKHIVDGPKKIDEIHKNLIYVVRQITFGLRVLRAGGTLILASYPLTNTSLLQVVQLLANMFDRVSIQQGYSFLVSTVISIVCVGFRGKPNYAKDFSDLESILSATPPDMYVENLCADGDRGVKTLAERVDTFCKDLTSLQKVFMHYRNTMCKHTTIGGVYWLFEFIEVFDRVAGLSLYPTFAESIKVH